MDGFVNVTAVTILACLWFAFAVALVASRSSEARRNVAAIKERLERGAQTNGGGQQ